VLFVACVIQSQARRKPQQGAGKHSRGVSMGEKNCRIFSFKMVHSGVLYTFWAKVGPQTLQGLG